MSWATANLRPASFRGVPFQVRQHESGNAKSVVVHELPLRHRPYIEELGRLAREFDIEAFLVGDDYQLRRDALLDAMMEEGPGELVHPWLGNLRVHGRTMRIRETATEGRMCLLALSFVEAGVLSAPSASVDGPAAVESSGALLLEQAAAEMDDAIIEATKPGAAAEGAAASWELIAEDLKLLDLSGPLAKAAAWRARLQALTDNALEIISQVDSAIALLGAPSAFASEVLALMQTLDAAFGSRRELIRILLRHGLDVSSRTGPLLYGGASADGGDAACRLFFARNAITEAARLSVLFDWESYDDAIAVRGELILALEGLGDGADDAAYQRTQDLIASLVANLPNQDANLPRLDTVTLLRSRPALVLAYQLYDGTARESDILARNHVRNPAFLPTQVPLQVLVDVS